MICPICGKRPAKRFCPAKGEKICAVSCGTGREVTIDCVPDCTYLMQAHRYEAEHRKPLSPDELPYKEIEFPADFVYEHWPVVAGLGGEILAFQAENREANDNTARRALEALGETYRTLETGIYYERPPDMPLARALYAQLHQSLADDRKQAANRAGFSSLKDADIFRLLVFMLRISKQHTNGRPLSRAFLGFLRERLAPVEANKGEQSRIIVP
jgi:hypothetical protein